MASPSIPASESGVFYPATEPEIRSIPGKLAIEATSANKALIAQMKASAVRKSAKEKATSEELARQISTVELTFERKVDDGEHLFGSVTSGDIAHALEAEGYSVDRRKIALEEPLKTFGEFHVPIKLHREVTAQVKVTIVSDAPAEVAAHFIYDRKAVERGIPLEALSSFVAESGLPMKDVLEAVIPLRTLKHRRARGEALTLDESDKLARVVRIYCFALDVFGNPEKARTFLLKPKQQFEGSTPLNLLRTDFGGREVEGMLWGIADGVFV